MRRVERKRASIASARAAGSSPRGSLTPTLSLADASTRPHADAHNHAPTTSFAHLHPQDSATLFHPLHSIGEHTLMPSLGLPVTGTSADIDSGDVEELDVSFLGSQLYHHDLSNFIKHLYPC